MGAGLSLPLLLQMLAATLPALLTNGAGLVIASMMLTRYPRPARLLLAGCGINLATIGLSFFLRTFVASWITGSSGSAQMFYFTTSIVSGVCYAIGLGFIIAAVFADRVPALPPEEGV
ncbi:MAG TPA: hypothetical protein VFG20_04700 [Planctomycetaceae bacterium]|nr:hypothetical protein [Planctomycetaceae bacterium]